MNPLPWDRYLIAIVVVVVLWLVFELWFEPSPKVRQTVRYLAGGVLVIILFRVFFWFVGWW